MNWNEIKITTNKEGVEVLTAELLNIGISGIQIQDADDFNRFLEGTEVYWDYVDESLMYLKNCDTQVILYIEDNEKGADTLTSLKLLLNELKKEGKYGSLEITLNNLKEEDWENNWKQYFKPFTIGKKFLIKPSWEDVDNKDGRKIIEIDPGMSFGTGTHETTSMCLELIESIDMKGKNVIDLGCGSGILSIGALLTGAEHLTCVDIDKNSIKVARENIEKNDFSDDKFELFLGDIISDKELREKIGFKKYDIILANIVADVLKAMSGIFGDFLTDNGILVVSGIIAPRKDEVLDKISENGFKLIKDYQKGDWVCAIFERN